MNPEEQKTEVPAAPDEAQTRILPRRAREGHAESEPEVGAVRWVSEALAAMPPVGAQFLNFDLIGELGRGSFGRVYLARQGELAHRLVALKITVDMPGEEQKLAQLQHTNVVPVYSYHRAGPFHAVCMPFFGAATLADIVGAMRTQTHVPGSGRTLVEGVRSRGRAFLDESSDIGSALATAADANTAVPAATVPTHALTADEDVPVTMAMLEQATYVEAVLWLAERLTEGLSHAHERGILHRDLKPANILLTNDGQPMLLDFNLSADIKLGSGLKEQRVGGTLPYMAPEQLASLQGSDATVDERSDVYSLGVILYELLTGRLPFTTPPGPLATTIPGMIAARLQPPPLLRPWNPAVSYAVESLVRHCLEGDPRRRYSSARHLREDLRRQRQNRPLRHAPEPSLRERMGKWARRHPRLVSPTNLARMAALVLALVLAPFGWQAWKSWEQTDADRQEALRKAEEEVATIHADAQLRSDALTKYQAFRESLGSPRAVMESVNAVQVLPRFMKAWTCEEARLDASAQRCRQSLAMYDMPQDGDWQDRPMVRHLSEADAQQLRRDMMGLSFAVAQAEQVRASNRLEQTRRYDSVRATLAAFGVGLEPWSAWQATLQAPLQSALDLNDKAQRCCVNDAMPRALLIQRADLLQLLGNDAEAKRAMDQANAAPVVPDAEDAYWTASALAAKGDFKNALPLLGQAVSRSPDHYGAWLLRGICLTPRFSDASIGEDQGDRQQAFECLTTCILMRPNEVWARYNRGLVNYYLNFYQNAVADFDHILQEKVLTAQPALTTAYVPRATARIGLHDYVEAERDLSTAIALEPDVLEYYFLRADVRAKLKKTYESRADEQKVLDMTPTNFEGWTYRGMLRSAHGLPGALADFDQALALDPDDPLTLFRKGHLLTRTLNRHKQEEAIRVLTRALAIKPDFVDARATRGLAHAVLGQRAQALSDADATLKSEPTPQMHYHAARIYALTSRQHPTDADRAIELLKRAVRGGYGVSTYRDEPDLTPLQDMPEFERITLGLKLLGVPVP